MAYTGQNPKFNSTVLKDIGVSSIANPASGSHRIINRAGTLQVQDSSGLETAIGAGGTVDKITQTAHGFVVGEVLYYTGSAYAKAKADTSATAEVIGMVSRVIDANTFDATLEGKVTGLTGLTAGEAYFLSAATAGAITATEPSTLGYVSLPVGVAISTTVIYVRSSRGAVVGSVNARTEIALANNATTNVQSVAAYQAGELTGWVEIDGTTDSKFYVSAPFAKNGLATDYNISPQYVGDTPPVGFSITVTSAGLIQATLPSITGYVSAKINYALNAPAVGATFPLSIDSTLVQFSTLKAKDSGGFIFQENGGTQIGSISDAGAWALGSSSSATHSFQVGTNKLAKVLDTKPSNMVNPSDLTSFGTMLAVAPTDGDTTNYQGIFTYTATATNKLCIASRSGLTFTDGSAGQAGGYNSTGGWTFGVPNTDSSHQFHGVMQLSGKANGDAIFNLNAIGAGDSAEIGFLQGGVNKWAIGRTPGESPANFNWYNYTISTIVGSISEATGTWIFGNTSITSNHKFVSNTLTTNYPVLYCYHGDNTSTSNGNPGLMVAKRYNDNSGAQTFISFEINNSTKVPGAGSGSGRIAANGANAAQFQTYSDINLKENIFNISGELNKILSLRPVEFDYKSGGHQIGFIAQEIQEVYPDAVAENPQDGMLVLTGWDKTTARLVKAIQELSAKVTALENKGV